MLISMFILTSCRKENFVDPPDPFEPQRLEEGYLTFEFVNGIDSFRILTNKENVTLTDKGNVRIRGTIFADRDTLAPVKLSQGDFILLKGNCGQVKTATIDGYGELPVSPGKFKMFSLDGTYEEFCGFGGYSEFVLPKVGIVQDMQIDQPDGAPILFGLGSELPEEFPVNAERTYFYFYYDDEVDFLLSKSSFMINRMALDPDDPYFYVHASAMSIPGFSSLVEGGFAVSVEGMIPFSAPSSLDFGDVESFENGNLLLEGSIDLKPTFGVPILIADATAVIGFGRNMQNGSNFFKGEEVPFNMGLKGAFILHVHDLAQWQLGESAVSLRINAYNNWEFNWAGFITNEIRVMEPIEDLVGIDRSGAAWEFISPPGITTELKTWGTIGSDPDNWFFGMHTESSLHIPGLGDYDLSQVKFELSTASLYLDCRLRIGFFGVSHFGGYIKESGAFGISASVYEDKTFDLSILEVSVGYKVGFKLDVKSDGDWDFCMKGKAYLDVSLGEPFFEAHPEVIEMYNLDGSPLKLEFSANVRACLNNDGEFRGRISFSFAGVGYGFDFSFSLGGAEGTPLENFREIPLDEVPLENRFGSEVIVR